jgi:hypothetical protein
MFWEPGVGNLAKAAPRPRQLIVRVMQDVSSDKSFFAECGTEVALFAAEADSFWRDG